MRREINNDNSYKVGMVICAKMNPSLKLVIMNYRQRIYYCAALGDLDQNSYAYFERELLPPTDLDQQIQYRRVIPLPGISKNYVWRKP